MPYRPTRFVLPLLSVLLLPIVVLAAGGRDDYARQWPLVLADADAGAYRVTLDAEVYRSASQATLDDVAVFNADGEPVPAALFSAGQQLAQSPRTVALPWFPLPPGDAGQARDITQISERDADGRVRRVETRIADGVRADAAKRPANAWLVDASAIGERIVSLELDWQGDAPIDISYMVEGSDDLRDWRVLQPMAQLLDLTRDGQRLRQRSIALDTQARYLRLRPMREDASLPLTGVSASVVSPPSSSDWQWRGLKGVREADTKTMAYGFELDGRFPVDRIDVATSGNDASTWQLQSRDSDDAAWVTRAGPWVAFQLGKAGGRNRSAPRTLDAVVRDRYWRLASAANSAAVPTLRLGYRPEVLVFVARGAAPYALLAGSARAGRDPSPLPLLVEAIRSARGTDWQPAEATTGAAVEVSGAAALVPQAPERDWKSWLLWGVLVLGALMVVGLALSLLRKPATH